MNFCLYCPQLSSDLGGGGKLCTQDARKKLLCAYAFRTNRHIANYILLRSAKECMAAPPNLLSYMG